MTDPTPIAVYGGAGRIGSIICPALDAVPIERQWQSHLSDRLFALWVRRRA